MPQPVAIDLLHISVLVPVSYGYAQAVQNMFFFNNIETFWF